MLRTLVILVAVALAACSAPPFDSRYVPQSLPDQASFPFVAELLVLRCGSLDCHGKVGRNLRLYGSAGLRLSPADRPVGPCHDTAAEDDQDYESVVGLEPEVMSAVVSGGGAHPEQLTMVRKARGTEAHKGGQIWSQGDASDRCVTTWLAGKADAKACQAGVQAGLPTATPSCP